ncbi:MAG: T9SS type A sorting domain-containing protein, partial [Crocinitomicaceae bacterium]|nr:T9SS type A sorting domain-containing protein [Crocinitomicaceae bacterium]
FSGLGKINYRFEQPVHQPQMTFYNAMGAIVKQIRLNGNEGIVILNSEDFESGIYFYTLSHNGVLGTSRRMSVVR